MPHYIYVCDSCEEQQELFHSFDEDIKDCGLCGAEDSMTRLPSFRKATSPTQKTGQVVNEFIEQAKRDLQIEKDNKRKREK